MSKKAPASTNRASTNHPLRKVRILVGRARHQASALSAELRKLGAQVLEIPFIEIRQPRSYQPLDSALKNLALYDWLILTSVNGVEAMWARMDKLKLSDKMKIQDASGKFREGHEFIRAEIGTKSGGALATGVRRLRIAAIGPATKKAIEQRGVKVDVVPKEYVAESVVRSLRRRVKGKRVLLVRAKVARDVIPWELRKAGARVDVVEAYETVVPQSSRARLRAALENPRRRPHVVTFTSSSTVRNFVTLLGGSRVHPSLDGILTASIGPVTSSTLRELGLGVDIEAKEFTIPGLVDAIIAHVESAT
jgi:uroporphyrinogen-III synthase